MNYRVSILLVVLFSFFLPTSLANPQIEYQAAYKVYIAANASAAAYHDRTGLLACRYLKQEGWDIQRYTPSSGRGARFILAKTQALDGNPLYVLAIVGTESSGDVKTNLLTEKIATGSDEKDTAVASAYPKVHKGFYQFTQSIFSAVSSTTGASINFSDLLDLATNHRLYITGHSLGGAAATLLGAQLLDSGAAPDQVEVITFGAPAVGNAAFARQYQPQLHLTRVTMYNDPITGALQTLIGGYTQFGQHISWPAPPSASHPHQLTAYTDLAIKNYYDKRRAAIISPQLLPDSRSSQLVYIMPLQNNLPAHLTADYWYMQQALWDEYQRLFPHDRFEQEINITSGWRPLNTGYRWIIVPEVNATSLRNARNMQYITFVQTIYDGQTGAIVDTTINATTTTTFTPLGAFIQAFKGASDHTGKLITMPSSP